MKVYVLRMEMNRSQEMFYEQWADLSNPHITMLLLQATIRWFTGEPGLTVVVETEDKELIGMVRINYTSILGVSCIPTASIGGLYIKEEYRKTSVFFRMFRFVEKLMQEEGIERVQGVVLEGNDRLLNIWKKAGAKIRAVTVEKYYGRATGSDESPQGVEEGSEGSQDREAEVREQSSIPAGCSSGDTDHGQPLHVRTAPEGATLSSECGAGQR